MAPNMPSRDPEKVPLEKKEDGSKAMGFRIPDCPTTPSNGRAQHYARRGNPDHQTVRAFDNGTTLKFGPDDHIDDFKPQDHFYEQALLIQRARMDLLAAGAVLVGEKDEDSDENWDVQSFKSQFTSTMVRPRADTNIKNYSTAPTITSDILGSKDYFYPGEKGRRPKYSPSYYEDNRRGLNTMPGMEHPGFTTDCRFGVEKPLDGNPNRGHARGGSSGYDKHLSPSKGQYRSGHSHGNSQSSFRKPPHAKKTRRGGKGRKRPGVAMANHGPVDGPLGQTAHQTPSSMSAHQGLSLVTIPVPGGFRVLDQVEAVSSSQHCRQQSVASVHYAQLRNKTPREFRVRIMPDQQIVIDTQMPETPLVRYSAGNYQVPHGQQQQQFHVPNAQQIPGTISVQLPTPYTQQYQVLAYVQQQEQLDQYAQELQGKVYPQQHIQQVQYAQQPQYPIPDVAHQLVEGLYIPQHQSHMPYVQQQEQQGQYTQQLQFALPHQQYRRACEVGIPDSFTTQLQSLQLTQLPERPSSGNSHNSSHRYIGLSHNNSSSGSGQSSRVTSQQVSRTATPAAAADSKDYLMRNPISMPRCASGTPYLKQEWK